MSTSVPSGVSSSRVDDAFFDSGLLLCPWQAKTAASGHKDGNYHSASRGATHVLPSIQPHPAKRLRIG